MWVEVTQEDIEAGESGECTECPVALALSRAGFLPAVMQTKTNFFSADGEVVSDDWSHPVNVSRFIVDFDARRPVKPIKFNVPKRFLHA